MTVQFPAASVGIEMSAFPPTSRYAGVPAITHETADGRKVVHLARRFLPPADQFAFLQWHRVMQGERLDHIAAHYLGDPEAFWRLCDANNAMRPQDLTDTPARQLRITLPQGIPAQPHA
jgi:hypothetical protein